MRNCKRMLTTGRLQEMLAGRGRTVPGLAQPLVWELGQGEAGVTVDVRVPGTWTEVRGQRSAWWHSYHPLTLYWRVVRVNHLRLSHELCSTASSIVIQPGPHLDRTCNIVGNLGVSLIRNFSRRNQLVDTLILLRPDPSIGHCVPLDLRPHLLHSRVV